MQCNRGGSLAAAQPTQGSAEGAGRKAATWCMRRRRDGTGGHAVEAGGERRADREAGAQTASGGGACLTRPGQATGGGKGPCGRKGAPINAKGGGQKMQGGRMCGGCYRTNRMCRKSGTHATAAARWGGGAPLGSLQLRRAVTRSCTVPQLQGFGAAAAARGRRGLPFIVVAVKGGVGDAPARRRLPRDLLGEIHVLAALVCKQPPAAVRGTGGRSAQGKS